VHPLSEIKSISAGQYFAFAIKNDQTVWAWGGNSNGQLGDGTTINKIRPAQVSALTGITKISAGSWQCMGVKNDGTLWSWGGNYSGQLGDGTITEKDLPVQVTALCH
jgi:alpha-tubulin suppressor-like RCC1 family protein